MMTKTDFCEYWTSIKIKISMTCVSKDYKITTKIFLGGEKWAKLWLVGGLSPFPSVGKTLHATLCQSLLKYHSPQELDVDQN